MNFDTRGQKKWSADNGKRHNAREVYEREYKMNNRADQAAKAEGNDDYIVDDSHKFLKKMLEKGEKERKGQEKAKIYEQEMEKCEPKKKGGKHAL